MFLTALVICSLLFINGLLIQVFLRANYEIKDQRIIQALQFILPILLIFLQFWIYDRFTSARREIEP